MYSDVESVQREFKSVDFSDSNAAVDEDTVLEFIEQEEASIDSEIGTVYETPVTGSPATSVMKRMSIFMVKARIIDLLSVKSGVQKADQGGGADAYRQLVRDMLDRIKKKELILSGATLLESGGGVSSYSSSNSVEQVFQKDVEQW